MREGCGQDIWRELIWRLGHGNMLLSNRPSSNFSQEKEESKWQNAWYAKRKKGKETVLP